MCRTGRAMTLTAGKAEVNPYRFGKSAITRGVCRCLSGIKLGFCRKGAVSGINVYPEDMVLMRHMTGLACAGYVGHVAQRSPLPGGVFHEVKGLPLGMAVRTLFLERCSCVNRLDRALVDIVAACTSAVFPIVRTGGEITELAVIYAGHIYREV